MSPQEIASALLGVCGLFLISCCFLQGLMNQLDNGSVFFRHAFLLPSSGRGDRWDPRRLRRRPQQQLAGDGQRQHRGGDGVRRSDMISQRSQYESNLDPSVIEPTVRAMRMEADVPTLEESSLSYDIRQCPAEIPPNYPVQWNILDVLSNWNPDNTTVPSRIYQGLCSLDWKDPVQRDLAETYRRAEKPFLIHNHPELWRTAERWSHYEYLHQLLGGEEAQYRNEHSQGNHMPYWKLRGKQQAPPGWVAPTENVELTYPDWYAKAMQLEQTAPTTTDAAAAAEHHSNVVNISQAEHWYFRLNGAFDNKNENSFLYDELPIFLPTRKSFFMPEIEAQRGINCRFGSKGTIAETHYDFSRNFITILKGQKRYVLAHPNQCPNLELHPPGHPSARHSKVDWSNPAEWHTGRFSQAQVNEVILQAGDALYLPTSWFHFIVSLNLNYQCNARSGVTYENYDAITACGF